MRINLPSISEARDHFITALILVLSLGLLIARHQEGLQKLRQVSITIFSYMEKPLSDFRQFREALQTNQYLRRQNVLLLDKLSRLRSAERENKRLRQMLELERNSKYNLEAVQIVGKKLHGLHNTLTIDAGSSDGVHINMPVINEQGLLGRVILTSKHFSQVMPLYNTLFKVSARVQSSQATGIVAWDGTHPSRMTMHYVPQTIEVDSGQVIETSGYSNNFPPNIPIGIVTHTEPIQGKEIQRIYLNPFASIYQAGEGFVVKYRPDSSLINLKKNYRDQFQ